MSFVSRTQSIMNRPTGGGVKKAGLVNSANWPSIPRNILARKTK